MIRIQPSRSRSSAAPARVIAVFALACALSPARGQEPEPVDQPYPGTLTLDVDVSNPAQRIFRVHEVIPASPGPLSLHYPKWIPGEHGPTGTLDGVAGVIITAGGQRVTWRRDLADMFTLHLDVPAGASAVEVDFQFLSPTDGGEFGAGVAVTARIIDLEWNQVVFYPAGYFASRITVAPSITLPAGWGFGTALEQSGEAAGKVSFKTTSLEDLVDSPLIAGVNFKRVDLAPDVTPSVHLDIVADRPENLVITPAQLAAHRALVTQAYALYGAHHYGHYDFLLTLSDHTAHFGLEHHQSSDDRLGADYFTDPAASLLGAMLLPHEYTHSWNGKYRRPFDLWTPDYNHVPMKTDLLWVYEGLTEYFGDVLAARAGLRTPEQYRNCLAGVASYMANATGRSWRPLQDTADEAQILYNTGFAWSNYRRSVDFYDEGELIWLDVDTTIRELSNGARSIDDFAHAFYGTNDGSRKVVTYTFDDVVATLNGVQPLDWAAFLRKRLDSTDPDAPLGGITRGGWKLAYSEEPTGTTKASEKIYKYAGFTNSIGLSVDAGDNAGAIVDVQWQSVAFDAGLAPGMKIVAVNGDKYSDQILRDAITAAKSGTAPISLIVQNGDTFGTVKVDYHGGLRYPRLERIPNTPDRLADITKPRT
jgi:predicted metalloprotease with PDZ domain